MADIFDDDPDDFERGLYGPEMVDWQPEPLPPLSAEQVARQGYETAIDVLADVAERTGSPAARWAAEYLAADPDKQAPIDTGSYSSEAAG